MGQFWKNIGKKFESQLEQWADALESKEDEKKRNKQQHSAEVGTAKGVLHSTFRGINIASNKKLSLEATLTGGSLGIGASGSGKSSSQFIPMALSIEKNLKLQKGSRGVSLVIISGTDDERRFSAGYIHSIGVHQRWIDFSDAEKSCASFNFLAGMKPEESASFARAYFNASMNGNTGDPFWNLSGISVLSMLIRKSIAENDASMHTVRASLLRYIANPVGFQADMTKSHICDDLFEEFLAINSAPEKTLQNVLATVKASLEIFADPHVAQTTNDLAHFDLEQLRTSDPSVLHLTLPNAKMRAFSVPNSMFIERLVTFLMSRPIQDENAVIILIDEMSQLRVEPELIDQMVSQLRKYSCAVSMGVQSFLQLKNILGDYIAKTILSNVNSVLYLKPIDMESALMISEKMGRTSYKDKETGQTKSRPVMSVDEIMYGDYQGILFVQGKRGIPLKRIKRYYQEPELLRRSQMPIPNFSNLIEQKEAQTQALKESQNPEGSKNII